MNEKGDQPERRYDIVFRNVGNDCGPACGPELYDYWHVEAYDFERSWPLGIAFVADGTKSSSGTETAALLCFRLDYLFVIDEYRRQGVGTALLNAVKERWPSMCLDAATEGDRAIDGLDVVEPGPLRIDDEVMAGLDDWRAALREWDLVREAVCLHEVEQQGLVGPRLAGQHPKLGGDLLESILVTPSI